MEGCASPRDHPRLRAKMHHIAAYRALGQAAQRPDIPLPPTWLALDVRWWDVRRTGTRRDCRVPAEVLTLATVGRGSGGRRLR